MCHMWWNARRCQISMAFNCDDDEDYNDNAKKLIWVHAMHKYHSRSIESNVTEELHEERRNHLKSDCDVIDINCCVDYGILYDNSLLSHLINHSLLCLNYMHDWKTHISARLAPVLSLTWGYSYLGKTVFILRRGPDDATINESPGEFKTASQICITRRNAMRLPFMIWHLG